MLGNTAGFVHLHVHSAEGSHLDSVAKVKDLVSKAKECGMEALALTDHGTMYGVLRFYKECKKQGIKPVIGCEIYVTNDPVNKVRDNYHLVLLAKDNEGYINLCKIVSEATENFYYRPRATKEILRRHSRGIIALTGCIGGEVCRAIRDKGLEYGKKVVSEYLDIFGRENLYLEIQKHGLPEEGVYRDVAAIAKDMDLKIVATNDVHYISRKDAEAQDMLFCIREKKQKSDSDRFRMPTDLCYFRTQQEMESIFNDYMGCLSNTAEIAGRCNAEIEMKQDLSPHFPGLPEGETEQSFLRRICEEALPKMYPFREVSLDTARERMDYELSVIGKMKYSGYFLIVRDFIIWAKEHGIMIGPGRGSGAGSIVCYLSGITRLEPISLGLLFERFLNPARVSMPDIDTDIQDSGRDAVAEYMMERYGRENSAKIVTFQTMAAKAAIRDAAKALGLSFAEGSAISGFIPDGCSIKEALEANGAFSNEYAKKTAVKTVTDIAMSIEGLPRQHGSHAAGVVISRKPLKDVLPVSLEKNSKTGRAEYITEFDKDEVEQLGLLKMDLLGLVNLSIISDCIRYTGKNIDIEYETMSLDDPDTMKMLREGRTLGVFQLESTGITELVKKLAPESYHDMIPLVALYRPGPLGSGMVDDFVECRHGRKEISYLHPWLEPILKETYGVILYQEQVMQIVQTLGGFTLGEADVMRRAMGHKEPELLKAQEQKFVDGCSGNNIGEELSRKIFNLMLQFASYGFNKSHSAAYAFVAYQTAYLKAHYPAEYMAAYLTHMADKKEKLAQARSELLKTGIKILPLDINRSGAGFIPDGKDIRIGFGIIKGLGNETAKAICEERKNGLYADPFEMAMRVPSLNENSFAAICELGAFNKTFGRQKALAVAAGEIFKAAKKKAKVPAKTDISLSLFSDDELASCEASFSAAQFCNDDDTMFSDAEMASIEMKHYGFYASKNPMDKYADRKNTSMELAKKALEEGTWKKSWNGKSHICGMVESIRIVITKKGETMCFLTLSTTSGWTVDCVIFPEAFSRMDTSKSIFEVTGTPELRNGKLQFIVGSVKSLE